MVPYRAVLLKNNVMGTQCMKGVFRSCCPLLTAFSIIARKVAYLLRHCHYVYYCAMERYRKADKRSLELTVYNVLSPICMIRIFM